MASLALKHRNWLIKMTRFSNSLLNAQVKPGLKIPLASEASSGPIMFRIGCLKNLEDQASSMECLIIVLQKMNKLLEIARPSPTSPALRHCPLMGGKNSSRINMQIFG